MVMPLAARAKGPGFDSPIAQHVLRLISRAFYKWRGWFTGIELVLGPTSGVHLPPEPLDSIV